MVKLNYNGDLYEFPSEFTEITIEQLDMINSFFEEEVPELIQWVNIIGYLTNIPVAEIEKWNIEDFTGIISHMFVKLPKKDNKITIKLGEYTFKAPREVKLSVRQTAHIEKALSTKPKQRFTYILDALLIEVVKKDAVALTQEERIKLFSESPAKLFMSTIMKFGVTYVGGVLENLKRIKEVHDAKAVK